MLLTANVDNRMFALFQLCYLENRKLMDHFDQPNAEYSTTGYILLKFIFDAEQWQTY